VRGRAALSLVEVLVALALVGLNGTGLVAALLLAISLFGRAAELLHGLDMLSAGAACGLALAAPRAARARSRTRMTGRHGLGLVELLVALAIGALVLTLLAALVRAEAATRGALEERAEWSYAQHGLRLAVEAEVATAGARLGTGECGVATRSGGAALELSRRGADGALALVTLEAGRDAAGRPALYRRLHPHPRQPWLEDVTSFHVAGLEGVPEAPERIAAVHLELRHERGGELRWRALLPHQPCFVPGGG
jgi:prepilin-type N-terminal cleavage/methylation domain-containing protein